MKKVLALSSAGGHWVQLRRLRPAFEGSEIHYACPEATYQTDLKSEETFHLIPEANRWNKLKLIWLFIKVFFLVLRLRPDVIITTGAAPGFFAIMIGRKLGSRTVWIDSIANSEELSMSGIHASKHADLYLTQWPHLAQENGPYFKGAVL